MGTSVCKLYDDDPNRNRNYDNCAFFWWFEIDGCVTVSMALCLSDLMMSGLLWIKIITLAIMKNFNRCSN